MARSICYEDYCEGLHKDENNGDHASALAIAAFAVVALAALVTLVVNNPEAVDIMNSTAGFGMF